MSDRRSDGPAQDPPYGRAMHLRELRTAGHAPSLAAALLHFDVSFMAWVLLGALGAYIGEDLGLSASAKGLMVAVPLLAVVALLAPGGDDGDLVVDGEGLTLQQAQAVDAMEQLPVLPQDKIVLVDGRTVQQVLDEFGASGRGRQAAPRTPQDYKSLAISQMVARAQQFTDRSLWQYADEGPNKPAQNGLAYSLGSKDPTVRQRPSTSCCTDQVHGLDCSGLVHLAAQAAGINLPVGTAALQGQVATWNAAFPAEWRLQMKRVNLTTEGYETGDIICWGGHIGIVVVDGFAPAGVSILQSNGVSGCSNGAEDSDACAKNRGPNRGPRRIPLVQAVSSAYFGAPSAVLRIIPDAEFTVKLTWGGQPDVDLHVIEPDGTQVYYGHRQGTNGYLDVDDTQQFGPEHYFIQNLADGDYKIGAAYYSGSAPETARITITAGPQTRVFDIPLPQVTGNTPIIAATVRVSTDPATGERKVEILETRGRAARPAPDVPKGPRKP